MKSTRSPLPPTAAVGSVSASEAAITHLVQMEVRYREPLEAAPDAMVVVNQGGEIVLLNLQAQKQFGYRRDELVGQQVTSIIPDGFAERLRSDGLRSAEDALAQQIGMGIELIGRRKDGSRFPIELMLSPLASDDGILVTAAIRDISVRKAAEKHLAQMEGRYRGLLEAAPDGMVVVNQGGDIVLLNLQAENQFGYRRDELVGHKVKTIIPEGFAERLISDGTRSAEDALAQQIGTGIELIGRRRDGSGFPIELMLSPLASDDGILVTAAIRDISVRKAAEKHLAQMEGRYRGLLEAAPDAMVVVNQGGDIVLLNLQAERQFGYRRDELVGHKVKTIIPEGFAERLLADGTRSAEDALAQQIGTGIELIGRRKDGSGFPIELMLSPLASDEGILVTAAIRDISVRKAAEKHLAQMEDRYRGLLEAAPDAMVVVNQSGDIVLLNLQAENQFGYRRDELIGRKVKTIIPEGFAERLISDGTRSAEDALAQQIGMGIELIGRRKDGSRFPIELMLSPLASDDGILVTAAIRDISVRKAAEKHLAQMEGRYRGLLEAAPDGMVVVNQGGDIVLLNLQAENQFGYRRDELVGHKVKTIIPEGFAERLISDGTRSAEDALAQQIGTGIELIGRRRDGSGFPIELMLSPLASDDGILVTAAIRDISVRKAAEKHLAQMEGRYRGLLEAAPDAMVVVNQGGDIVLLNLQAENQFGYRRDELVGQKVTNIIPQGFAERLISDGTRSAEDALAQQIGTGIELIGRRKDGSGFPIELMLSPLASDEGILVTAAIRDISVRKQMEEFHSRLAAIVDSSGDAIFSKSYDGIITSWNTAAERLFGYTAAETIGTSMWVLIPEHHVDEERQIFERLRRGDRIENFETVRLRKDGTEIEVSTTLSPIKDKSGGSIGISTISRDIAETKRTQRALVDARDTAVGATKELESFAYSVAHDLRAPLRHMDGFSQVLLEDYGGTLNDEAKGLLLRIRGASIHMGHLIDDLLKLSGISRAAFERTDVDLSAMSRAIVDELRQTTPGRRVAVEIAPDIQALADPRLMALVLQNLLGNAWKFTAKNANATIAFGVEQRRGRMAYAIRDNGVGFDMAYVDKLFAPFQRLHTNAEFEGTGIGLAIVSRVIHRHGGEVGAESAIGIGTVVYFTV